MGRLSEIFAENNAQGGSESISLEDRIARVEEMLSTLTTALIGSTEETSEEVEEETVEETETKEERKEVED